MRPPPDPSMQPLSPERRRNKRFELDLPIRVTRLEGKAVDFLARTHNVSSSGALMSIDAPPPTEGDRIEFLMRLEGRLLAQAPGPVTLRCRGRVVRTSERGKGADVAATIDRYQFVR